jgi:hypothetical protein
MSCLSCVFAGFSCFGVCVVHFCGGGFFLVVVYSGKG